MSDVEGALASVKKATAEQAAQQATLKLAQSSDGSSAGAFRSGTSTTFALLVNETLLYTAQDALAQARIAPLKAIVGLFGALGGGWDAGGQLSAPRTPSCYFRIVRWNWPAHLSGTRG